MNTRDQPQADHDGRVLATHLELIYQRGGMAAVVAACRAAQHQIAKAHPRETFNSGWIV